MQRIIRNEKCKFFWLFKYFSCRKKKFVRQMKSLPGTKNFISSHKMMEKRKNLVGSNRCKETEKLLKHLLLKSIEKWNDERFAEEIKLHIHSSFPTFYSFHP